MAERTYVNDYFNQTGIWSDLQKLYLTAHLNLTQNMAYTQFNVFQVYYDSESSNYETFESALKSAPPKNTVLKRNGNSFELDGKIKTRQSLYYGTFCLIQTNDLPPIKRPGQSAKPLTTAAEDEGLGHYTSFIFDPEVNIIAIQKNQNGVLASGIAEYFKRTYTLRNFELKTVIDPSEIEQLTKLKTIRSLEISIAKVENGEIFQMKGKKSFGDITSLADQTNANTMFLRLGMGYEKKASLTKANVIQLIRKLVGSQTKEVRRVQITGSESDEESMQVYDFLTNKVVLNVSLPKSRHISDASITSLITAAIEEYKKIKPNITKVYKVRNNN